MELKEWEVVEERVVAHFDSKLKRLLVWIVGMILGGLTSLVAGAVAWGRMNEKVEFNSSANTKQTDTLERVSAWQIEAQANRWTVHDHDKYRTQIESQISTLALEFRESNRLQELRLQRLEDNQSQLQRAQSTVDDLIKNKLNVTPADVLDELRKLIGQNK